MELSEGRIRRTLRPLPTAARRELLEVLSSGAAVRAAQIHRLHDRPETRDLADVLIEIEAEPILRLGVMEIIRESLGTRA